MKRTTTILALVLLTLTPVSQALAQTAAYPGAIATTKNLPIAKNRISTYLLGGITATSTSFTVRDATGIIPNMLLSIGRNAEVVFVCGVAGNIISVGYATCPNIDGRGYDSTTATSNTAGAVVQSNLTAWNYNALSAEIRAIETTLGVNLINVPGGGGGTSITPDVSGYITINTGVVPNIINVNTALIPYLAGSQTFSGKPKFGGNYTFTGTVASDAGLSNGDCKFELTSNTVFTTKCKGSDGTVRALGGNALVTNPLSQFESTTSSQLRGIMSDPTGTGPLMFGTSPTTTGTLTGGIANFSGAGTFGGALSAASTITTTGTGPLIQEFGDENGLLAAGGGFTVSWQGATGRSTSLILQLPTSDPSGNNRVPIWGAPVSGVASFGGWANAAIRTGTNTYSGSGLQDFSQVPTRPFQSDVIANIPATCSAGQHYYGTDSGRDYTCTATNTWLPSATPNAAGTGIVARTGTNSASARTITGVGIIVPTNGDGVVGNPTIGISQVAKDTGTTPNAIAATITLASSIPDGTILSVSPGADSTGAVTLTINGGTPAPIVYRDNTVLRSGELVTGNWYLIVWDSGISKWRLQVSKRGGASLTTATTTGSVTTGNCVSIDSNGNHVDNGAVCGNGFTLQFGNGGSWSPAQATTTYFGHPGLAGTVTAGVRRVYIPKTSTLKQLYGVCQYANSPTTETGALSFRLNNTTDVSINAAYAITSNTFNATGLTQVVTAGDYFEIKYATPATWATPPTSVVCTGTAYFE